MFACYSTRSCSPLVLAVSPLLFPLIPPLCYSSEFLMFMKHGHGRRHLHALLADREFVEEVLFQQSRIDP